MSGAGQPPRDQTPAQSPAQHSEIRLSSRSVHRNPPGALKAMPVKVTQTTQLTEE
jgi:hypothetical protein